jgi:hypothetical protein
MQKVAYHDATPLKLLYLQVFLARSRSGTLLRRFAKARL